MSNKTQTKKEYKQKEYYTVVSIEKLEALLEKAKEYNKEIYKDEPIPKFATLVLNFRSAKIEPTQLRILGV